MHQPEDGSISHDTGKTAGLGGVRRGHREGLLVGTKAFLEIRLTPQEGETEPSKLYILRMGDC